MNRKVVIVLLVAAFSIAAGCTKKDAALPDTTTPPEETPSGPPPPPPPPTNGSITVVANDSWRYQGGTETQPEDILVRVTDANDTIVHLRSTTTALNNGSTTNTLSTIDARSFALMVLEDGRLGATLKFTPPLAVLIPATDHVYTGTVTVPTPLGNLQQPARSNISFLGLENVTVPAGTFETYHYRAVFHTDGFLTFDQVVDLWFSPIVKQAVKTLTDDTPGSPGDERLQELVDYELG